MKALEEELANDPLVDKVTTIFTASDIDSVEQWEQAMRCLKWRPDSPLFLKHL